MMTIDQKHSPAYWAPSYKHRGYASDTCCCAVKQPHCGKPPAINFWLRAGLIPV